MTRERHVGADRPHCLVCQSARTVTGHWVLARGLTVEASRLYALLDAAAQLPAGNRDAPGADQL